MTHGGGGRKRQHTCGTKKTGDGGKEEEEQRGKKRARSQQEPSAGEKKRSRGLARDEARAPPKQLLRPSTHPHTLGWFLGWFGWLVDAGAFSEEEGKKTGRTGEGTRTALGSLSKKSDRELRVEKGCEGG